MTDEPENPYHATDMRAEMLFLDFEDLIIDMREDNAKAEQALRDLTAALELKEISDDEPLKLEDAICLPELGGVFTVVAEHRTPSKTFSIKTLRKAISDGQLAVIRPNTKNLYVTRAGIRDWLKECHVQESPSNSSFSPTATKTASSRTGRSGTSDTLVSQSSQDAAKALLKKLRNS